MFKNQASWLDDFSLFAAIKNAFGGAAWREWPEALRDRNPEALESAGKELQAEIEKEKFLQYLFYKQWGDLKRYCHEKGVRIIGDIPIYVVYDSADVWTHAEFFKLTPDKQLFAVAGVPPDYFSKTGQRWGNPVYRWDVLQEKGYSWWIHRISHNLALYDIIRIDHFRGFMAYWEVPGEKDAVNGKWVVAPGHGFLPVSFRTDFRFADYR